MGAWFDLWECFMQRDMLLCTKDIREGYMVSFSGRCSFLTLQQLVSHVTDMSKERIVLIGHSQGGIIVSAWVDQLLTDFDESVLSRVEVYTFASAANHFSRGGKYVVENGAVKRLDLPKWPNRGANTQAQTNGSSQPDSSAPKNGPFRFVEHYANSGDFVAQLGVLSHKPAPAGSVTETYGVFAGQIFERKQHQGHGILDY
jgi:CRP-like cAMP-binding protein